MLIDEQRLYEILNRIEEELLVHHNNDYTGHILALVEVQRILIMTLRVTLREQEQANASKPS